MALKESDFTGPWTHPQTGRKYASFGDWFAGEPPLNDYLVWITPEMARRWSEMITKEMKKASFLSRFTHADRG